MSKLKNDIRDATLSNKAILKSDRDIETIKSLNKFAKRSGNILVLSGGYAVEAHCGGKKSFLTPKFVPAFILLPRFKIVKTGTSATAPANIEPSGKLVWPPYGAAAATF